MRKKGVHGYVNYHERGTCLKCLTTEIRSIKRIWDELKKRTKKKKKGFQKQNKNKKQKQTNFQNGDEITKIHGNFDIRSSRTLSSNARGNI